MMMIVNEMNGKIKDLILKKIEVNCKDQEPHNWNRSRAEEGEKKKEM